jgi:hypothetical protein
VEVPPPSELRSADQSVLFASVSWIETRVIADGLLNVNPPELGVSVEGAVMV